MDLSSYVPDQGKRSLIFEELLLKTGLPDEELRKIMLKNQNAYGQFAPEYPHSGSYMAMPCHFVSIREKVYFLQVVYQKDENSEMSFGSKSASRCGIKKSRMARYSLTDYQRMSDATQVNYVSSLVSFQSKDFEVHKVTVQRAEPTVFTRKKFVLSNRSSYPFQFYKNVTLDCHDTF